MRREQCWMTFSQALEQYLDARERKDHHGQNGRSWQRALADMQEAAEHMDALTAKE